jgi:hypothetical protein
MPFALPASLPALRHHLPRLLPRPLDRTLPEVRRGVSRWMKQRDRDEAAEMIRLGKRMTVLAEAFAACFKARGTVLPIAPDAEIGQKSRSFATKEKSSKGAVAKPRASCAARQVKLESNPRWKEHQRRPPSM